MKDDVLAALAKGMVPFVRQCVSEAITPLAMRLTEIEAQPAERGEKGPQGEPGPQGPPGHIGQVSPELAAKIAAAVRLLHESPSISDPAPPPPPKLARVERDQDGNFVPVYQ